MNRLTIGEIEKGTFGKLLQGNREEYVCGVSTDSRKTRKGDVFFPIIGEIHDAHKFIPQVIKNGCRTIVISDENAVKDCENCNIIKVDDTTRALQMLSAMYLKKLSLKKVAVTGSVGKTSTRDMTYCVLSTKYRTGRAEGNFNNDIGVPLTIFTFDDTMEAAVLETGMDHRGEIHRLAEIIKPDVGIITNIGISHIENLGSRQNILEAKLEITDFFTTENELIINSSNDMLGAAVFDGEYGVTEVGMKAENQFYIHDIEDYGENGIKYILSVEGKNYNVRIPVPGSHNAVNSALAVAAGKKFGIEIEEAVASLENLSLTGKRLDVKEAGGITVFDDTYNAAPDSMKSAINTLVHSNGKRKIAILGDMNELGPDSELYHAEIGRYAAENKIDMLIAIGPKALKIAEGAANENSDTEVLHYETRDTFLKEMNGLFESGDVIVVKASRTMELEKVVERIIEEQE